MSASFEQPSYDALIAEQAIVQAEKFQGRTLDEYSSYIFPNQNWPEPRGSAVVDFARPFIGDSDHVTLDRLLKGLSQAKTDQTLIWVDMGGGRALPMRQLGATPNTSTRLKMTAVDLFDYGLDGLKPDELQFLENLAPGMTKPEAAPGIITDNVETVCLPEAADIITAVEIMQYLNNPLAALANWYNQLTDQGILVVATEHDWTSWIRYDEDLQGSKQDRTASEDFLEELTRAGIHYAATNRSDWQSGVRPDLDPNQIRILCVQKKPGTCLQITKPVSNIWINPYNFKAIYYEAPTNESSPTVEVVRTDTPTALGAMTLKSVI